MKEQRPKARFYSALAAATQVQWEKSPARTGERKERVTGTAPMSDPTSDAALDPRRLAVRDAVKKAERALALPETMINDDYWTLLADELERTVQAWEGRTV